MTLLTKETPHINDMKKDKKYDEVNKDSLNYSYSLKNRTINSKKWYKV